MVYKGCAMSHLLYKGEPRTTCVQGLPFLRNVTMKKELPVGIDDFSEFQAGNYYYIDKTWMIQDMIQSTDEMILITRPHQFGKTVNMTMIREFFDITKDSRTLFKNLAIMETVYAKQINSRPVIYLTWKDCIGTSASAVKSKIAEQIAEEYENYRLLFLQQESGENDCLYDHFHRTYEMLDEVVLDGGEVNDQLLIQSVACLMKVIAAYYQVKSLVLIDDYDQPMANGHRQGFRQEMSDFFIAFFEEIGNSKEILGQIVMMGCQSMTRKKIFSELDRVSLYTARSNSKQYAAYFGFTADEASQLFACYGVDIQIDNIHLFDYQYQFARNQQMYSPKHIFSYIENSCAR